MKRTAIFTMVVFMVAVGSFAVTVKKDGTGDFTSVAAALAAASNGAEIIIGDSGTYVEDLTAGAGFQMVASFTLRAAAGQTPVIRSANTMERSGFMGIPGPDYFGAFLFGCQNVTIEGITFESDTTEVDAAGLASIVSVFDSVQVTIRNCTVRGPGGNLEYPGDNLNIVVVGLGAVVPPVVTIEDCLIEEGHIGIAIAKFPDPGVKGDPSVTVRNCTIQHCDAPGIEVDDGAYPVSPDPNTIVSGPGNLFENNTFIDTDTGISLGGGYSVLRNNTIIDSRDTGIDIDIDGDRGTKPITAIVANCTVLNATSDGIRIDDSGDDNIIATITDSVFVGGKSNGARIDEGEVTFERCIFAGNANWGMYVREDKQKSTTTVNHCDFYMNRKGAAVDDPNTYEILVDIGLVELLQLNLRNSIIVGKKGIFNGSLTIPDFDEEGCFASYCNVFVDAEPYTNVVTDHEVSGNPMYANPSINPAQFTREGFKLLAGSSALTSDENGSYLGSQGPAPAGLGDWMIH